MTEMAAAMVVRAKVVCGVVAGPVFVGVFTVLGARRAGYDWRRHAVSSLAAGSEGAAQRANFMLVGGLYCIAARGLAQSSRQAAGPPVVPALILGAGLALIGSGVFVTDPVAGFPPPDPVAGLPPPEPVAGLPPPDPVAGLPPPEPVAGFPPPERVAGFPLPEPRPDHPGDAGPLAAPTREGQLHNLLAIPIFVGVPVAALGSAAWAARRREYRWAGYSAGSAIGMTGTALLFGAAFGGAPQLNRWGGLLQRISITTGLGWLTAVSCRALRSVPRG